MKNKIICFVLIAITCVTTYSQVNIKEAKGNKEYDKRAYRDAIKSYELIYNKGYQSPNMLLKLGNAYYFNAELEKANKWYEKLYTASPEQETEFYYRFAQTLKATKDYTKSDTIMTKFGEKSVTDSRAKLFSKNRDYLDKIKKNSGRYKIDNASINTKYSDYGTAYVGTKVVFSSARDTGNFSKRIHTWTGQSFTNLYSSPLAEDGSLGAVDKFGKKLNTKFHEDTPAFTKDGKTVYFTRNDYLDHRGYDAGKVTLLKIYKATVDKDGQWNNITPLPFNSGSYQAAHPTLSPDEKTLYFASDMPETRGQSDLYMVKINDDGSFGNAENLGDAINTEGRETYPFISDDNELYFASDGHPGLGGLDIFITRIPLKGAAFKEPLNVGEEANSSKDDFALIINSKSKRGFLSSNRDGGQGSDDIYNFVETKPIWCDQILNGVITEENMKAVLPNTKLILFDEKFNQIKEAIADTNGNYQFLDVECGTKYYVRASLADYTTKEVPVILGKETGKAELNIELKTTNTYKVKIGDDLAETFKTNIIYFDLGKWNIRPDAAVDLAKLLDVLKQNPSMKINIRSHTDSGASFTYNQKLSNRRAKSTKDWLIKNGIAANRLSSEGLGEKELVNKCADGVPCTEAEHQLNRRLEFIITEL